MKEIDFRKVGLGILVFFGTEVLMNNCRIRSAITIVPTITSIWSVPIVLLLFAFSIVGDLGSFNHFLNRQAEWRGEPDINLKLPHAIQFKNSP